MRAAADRSDPAQPRSATPARPRAVTARPVPRGAAALTSRSLAMLQRTAGNSAVAGLVAGRGPGGPGPAAVAQSPAVDVAQRAAAAGAVPAAPVAPRDPDPTSDPGFTAVTGSVTRAGRDLKKHPRAGTEVGKAQAAAKAPSDDRAGQAKAAQVDTMAAAKPKGFDKAGFIAAVRSAIAAAAPRNLDEADHFATSGKAEGVKGQVLTTVTKSKDASAADVTATTKAAPDPSVARPKPETPLAEATPASPPAIDAGAGMPAPAPAEQLNLAAGPHEVDQQMQDAEVTEEHLARSNEPELQDAAVARREAQTHSATAPGAIRAAEAQTLQGARAGAQGGAKTAMAAMALARSGALGRVSGSKVDTKAKDEQERARVSADVNRIFDTTKAEVEVILGGLDTKVAAEFDRGEAQARADFTKKHQTDMEAYKDDRYSGLLGGARWLKDKLAGLPAEADRIFVNAKTLYEARMTAVISGVADLIGRELDAAKARIALGQQQIKEYVAAQPRNLQKVAATAGKEIGSRFEQLESDVEAKQQSLVDDLANRYVESRTKVDDEIKAEQEANKGLVAKAKDAVVGAIGVILKLKDLFLNLLSRAAGAFTAILNDPVTFIGNFMTAVKQGFQQFVGKIWEHLKKGLLGWLFGALAEGGVELPEKFDVRGILKLVASVLGLTWANLKNRIMKMAPWVAKVIDVVESKIEVFTILATEGVAGLWNWITDKIGDLKDMILTPIKDFVVEKIVKAGISWVLGMLNPAGALVKIVQALIGVVSWIMERGAALMDFVGTVIDSVVDIAKGGIGGVPDKIEASLAKAVPLVISFLANLLGLGGISDTIRSILQTVQKPVNQALGAVIKGGLKLARPLIAGVKGIGAKAKAQVLGGDDSPEGRQKRLDKGMAAGVSAANRFAGKAVGERVLKPVLGLVGRRYGLPMLEPVRQGANWAVHGEVQRVVAPTVLKAEPAVRFDEAPATKLKARGLDHAEIQHVFDQNQLDKVKSAIMEGMLARAKIKQQGGAGKGQPTKGSTPVPHSQFIAGRRITMRGGADFSDGIQAVLGVSDDGKTRIVRVEKIFEAKASKRQRDKLATDHERYSRIGKTPDQNGETETDKLRREVVDDLIEQHFPEAVSDRLTPAAARDAHQAAKRKVMTAFASRIDALMASKYRQRTTGQAVRNQERLSPDIDVASGSDIPAVLFIDALDYRVVGYTPQSVVTVGVLTSDVAPGDAVPAHLAAQGIKAEFENLDITAAALSALASEVWKAKGR